MALTSPLQLEHDELNCQNSNLQILPLRWITRKVPQLQAHSGAGMVCKVKDTAAHIGSGINWHHEMSYKNSLLHINLYRCLHISSASLIYYHLGILHTAVIKQASLLTVHTVYFHLWIGCKQLIEAFATVDLLPKLYRSDWSKSNNLRINSQMGNHTLYDNALKNKNKYKLIKLFLYVAQYNGWG